MWIEIQNSSASRLKQVDSEISNAINRAENGQLRDLTRRQQVPSLGSVASLLGGRPTGYGTLLPEFW